MNALERLAKAGTNSVGSHTFIDADTIRDQDGTSYRLQGYDAPEVAGFKGGQFTGGTAGGADATRTITTLAESQGYNNVVKTGKFDPNGREIIELRDAQGRNFTTELLKSGALQPGKYTTQSDLDAIDAAKAFGHQSVDNDEFGRAAKEITEAIDNESVRDIFFRQGAIDEAGYALGGGSSAVSFRDFDRDLKNNSLNPLSDAWDQGLIGAKEGYFGFLELLGETAGNDWVKDIGEAGIERSKSQQAEYGKVLTDWKDVNGFKSGVSYIANNAAMSLPYLIGTAAATGAGALAAPVVGVAGAIGIGLSAPAAVYAGQTWNEMEGEKNAGIALSAGLAQAALDRLGLGAIKGVLPSKLPSAAIQKIMEKTGVSKAAAEKMFANATKESFGEFASSAGELAAKQLAAKHTVVGRLKDVSSRIGAGAVGEGLTEVLQEATAYNAAVLGSDKQFDWEELNSRLTAAALAGSTLGGTFAAPGAIKQDINYQVATGNQQLADERFDSNSAVYANEEKKNLGYVPTIKELINNTRSAITSHGSGTLIQDRALQHREAQAKKPTIDKLAEAGGSINALWEGSTRNIFGADLQRKSRSARILADMFGGNLQKIFSGSTFENAKHHYVAKYKNMVSIPTAYFSALNDGKKFSQADKEHISNRTYDTLRAAVDAEGNFNPDAIPDGPHKDAIIKLGNELKVLGNKMYADQKQYNPELGYIDNYLFKYKAFNKARVHKNRDGFAQLLMKKFGYSRDDAKELTDAIAGDPNVADLAEAFSVVKGGIVPSSHKKRSLGLSEDADFKEFMENDIFANVSHAAKSAARYTAHREYIGENGAVVSKLLDQMEQEGVDTDTVNKTAAKLQDYLDAESGNYKRPTSEFGKKMQKVQKNAMMLMTFSGLPLAVFSSIVEYALTSRGLTQEQISRGPGNLQERGKEMAKGITKFITSLPDTITNREHHHQLDENQEVLRDLGFYEWDVGAATVTGVTETNAFQQNLYTTFFKAIGLQQWTDYTRAIRASMAGDYFTDHAQKIADSRRSGQPRTREIQASEEALRNLGMNVDTMLPLFEKQAAGVPFNPEEEKIFNDNIRESTFNFINEAIALPQSANRPLIYQDPRFALFTQFQGFLATFTANHLPKLWGDYVKRGTPGMTYHAFGIMATMIMLGFASQHMKDWLKYGLADELDDEDVNYDYKTGRNPYLDSAEYVRRGVMASGLLGTGERIINAAFPIYEQHSDNPGEWLYNQATGESPALGYVQRVAGAAGALAQGDVGRAAQQATKAAPGFGPFSGLADKVGATAADWNFNGG